MRNPRFYVSGKRPFGGGCTLDLNALFSALRPRRTPYKDRICTCMYSKYCQNKAMMSSYIYNDDLFSCETLPLHWNAPSLLYVRDNHAVLSIYCYTHWESKLVGQKDDSVKIGKSKFDYRVSAEKHSVLLDFSMCLCGYALMKYKRTTCVHWLQVYFMGQNPTSDVWHVWKYLCVNEDDTNSFIIWFAIEILASKIAL